MDLIRQPACLCPMNDFAAPLVDLPWCDIDGDIFLPLSSSLEREQITLTRLNSFESVTDSMDNHLSTDMDDCKLEFLFSQGLVDTVLDLTNVSGDFFDEEEKKRDRNNFKVLGVGLDNLMTDCDKGKKMNVWNLPSRSTETDRADISTKDIQYSRTIRVKFNPRAMYYHTIPGPEVKVVEEKTFMCSYKDCSATFSKNTQLKTHLRRHKGEKPYKCSRCEWCFPRSDELARHMRSHTGERPYKCPQCDKRFSRSDHCSKHAKTHRKNKQRTVSNKLNA